MSYHFKFIRMYGAKKEERATRCLAALSEGVGLIGLLESLPLEEADSLLVLLEELNVKINVAEIYNSSEKLKNTNILVEYEKKLKSQVAVGAIDSKALIDIDESVYQIEDDGDNTNIQTIIDKTYAFNTLTMNAVAKLTDYAKVNMEQLPDGSFKSLRFVSSKRASALEDLFDVVTADDREDFVRLTQDTHFKKKAGYYDTSKMTTGYLTLYSLWPIVEEIKAMIAVQSAFYEKFSDSLLLVNLFRSELACKALGPNDWASIYQFSEKEIFINAMIRFKRLPLWRSIPVVSDAGHVLVLSANSIVTMTNYTESQIDITNQMRYHFGITQCIPSNYIMPGLSEDSESLPKELLYQFEKTDMANADSILAKQYEHCLRNFLNTMPRKDVKSKQQFVYVPTTLFPILSDPEVENRLTKRSEEFYNQLRSLVRSAAPQDNLIICGVLNMSGTHYVPYFIYKNVNGLVKVITVDPSPQLSKWSRSSVCPKLSAQALIKKCFQHIFPGCEHFDPNVTQQLRQRDCGPNALTVVEDAFKTVDSQLPLISIQNQTLVINVDSLSVNGNKKRIFDFVSNAFLYSADVVLAGNENRRIWSRRLIECKTQSYMQPDFAADNSLINVMSAYNFYDSELLYDYAANINSQSHNDDLSVVRDMVATAIIATGGFGHDIDAIKRRFVRSFALPDAETINIYIQRIRAEFPAVLQEVESAHLDIYQVLISIFDQNVKDCYPEAIVNYFDRYIPQYTMNDPSEELDVMINAYLSTSRASQYYIKLSPEQKRSVYAQLSARAGHDFSDKKYAYNMQRVESAIKLHVKDILEVSVELALCGHTSRELKTVIVTEALKKNPVYAKSISYISAIHPEELAFLIEKEIDTIVLAVSNNTRDYLVRLLNTFDSLAALSMLNVSPEPHLYHSQLFSMLVSEDAMTLRKGHFVLLGDPSASASSSGPGTQAYPYLVTAVYNLLNSEMKALIKNKVILFIAENVGQVIEAANPLNALSSEEITELANNAAQLKIFTHHCLENIAGLKAIYNQFSPESYFARTIADYIFELLSEEVQIVSKLLPQQRQQFSNYLHFMQTVLRDLDLFMRFSDHEGLQDLYLDLSQKFSYFTSFPHHMAACIKLPMSEVKVMLRTLQKDMVATLQAFMESMLTLYVVGESDFTQLTARFRVLLAYGLNFNSWPNSGDRLNGIPGYMHHNLVLLDNLLINKAKRLSHNHFINDKPYRLPSIIVKHSSVPATYGVKISISLLAQMLGYCINALNAKGFEYKAIYKNTFVLCLLDILEYAPFEVKDDEPLARLIVNRLLESIQQQHVRYEIMGNKELVSVYKAILNSENFSPTRHQQPEQDKNPVRYSDIKEILTMHTVGLSNTQAIAGYLYDAQYPLAQHVAPKADVFKAGFWARKIKYTDVVKIFLELLDTLSARRHLAVGVDFSLDESDLDHLAEVLGSRWEQLKSNDPTAYQTFKHSLDRVCLPIALALKEGYKNLGMTISAYQLLMPGEINSPTVELCDYAKNQLMSEDHIDSYNYSDIIILPDKTWISAMQLQDSYKRVSKLMNTLTGMALTAAAVKHVVNVYPEVAQKLCQIFMGLHGKGISVPTKQAMLEYLNNSVFVTGFSAYYGSAENARSQAALSKLTLYINSMNSRDRDLLLGLKVPSSTQTLREALSSDSCITYVGLTIGKILYYNCPEITLEDLGPGLKIKYHDIAALGRCGSVSKTVDTKMYRNEEPLLHCFMKKFFPKSIIPAIEPIVEVAVVPSVNVGLVKASASAHSNVVSSASVNNNALRR